jgi:type I restriction enzyme, S subunit
VIREYAASTTAKPHGARICGRFRYFQKALNRGAECGLSPRIYDNHIVPLSKGSASPHLNIGLFRKFPLVLPPVSEQQRIVAYLYDMQVREDALKQAQAESAAELDALLPAVLDRAFRGEL